MIYWLVGVLLLLLVAYQLYVSVQVFRSDLYEYNQKTLQIIAIWCIPLLGAMLCQHMAADSAASATGNDYSSEDGGDYSGGSDGVDGGGGD